MAAETEGRTNQRQGTIAMFLMFKDGGQECVMGAIAITTLSIMTLSRRGLKTKSFVGRNNEVT